MSHYFFDVHTPAIGTRYDYTGRRCASEEDANHMGQLVALDLGTTDPALWAGATVKVRTVTGKELFSIPVQELDLVAA